MAQVTFRMNVTPSIIPFLSKNGGASVIIPNQDMYYVRPNQFTGETADTNLGIPQLIFIENVMPVSFGFSSVGFTNSTAPFPGGLLQADQMYYLRSQTGRRYLANFNRQNGKFFIYSPEVNAWKEILTVAIALSQGYTCMVKGRCFFGFKNHNELYEFKDFNTTTGLFEYATYNTLGGIDDLTQIRGITSANNFLIMWTNTLLLYTIPGDVYGDVPDFTPSLGSTAAASETPDALKGIIITCMPTNDGFHIFTSTNIIAAYYSSNLKFPWAYRELEGSAAINDIDSIAADRDGYSKYCYTSAGLLKIAKSACSPAFIEASEFLGNNQYEYFDWPSKEIILRNLSSPLRVGLSYVANRWLVISYGAEGEIFTHAIVYDEHLKRWGKIQRNHARCVEFFGITATLNSIAGYTYQELLNTGYTYQDLLDLGWTYATLGGADIAGNPDIALEYKSLGFVTADGVVQAVNFDNTSVSDKSVAILGRIQFSRSHRFKILSVWLEAMNDDPTQEQTKLFCLCSNDMKNTSKTIEGFRKISASGGVKKYNFFRAEGLNHRFRIEGDFDLSTIVVVGTPTGTAYL